MKALIIEDEIAAANNLKAILQEVAPYLIVLDTLDSVASAVEYINTNEMPELVFMDIQLADGESFSIFKKTEITCPIIFTTAYDSFALEAFKVNSIDYLLKPIEPGHVVKALNKLKQLSGTELESYSDRVSQVFKGGKEYTRTLLVSFRDKLIPVPVNQIAFFYTRDELTTLSTMAGKEWQVDKSLDTLSSGLDPSEFFRANRQYLISHKAIKEVVIWFGNRLSVSLTIPTSERIIISKAKVGLFKKWLTKNQT